jgi:erythrocyte band 7 integral membrane protein
MTLRLLDPYRAAFGIADLRQALVERAQTTLRYVVGARTVQSIVVERETIALEIDSILSEVGDKWGVSIEGVLIKYDICILWSVTLFIADFRLFRDIVFSPEVAASLSSAAQQKRIGEAKVIAAKAEVDAAR